MVFNPCAHIDSHAYALYMETICQLPSYAQHAHFWQNVQQPLPYDAIESAKVSSIHQSVVEDPAYVWNSDHQTVIEEPAYVWNVEYLNQTPCVGALPIEPKATSSNEAQGDTSVALGDYIEKDSDVTTAMVRNLPDHIKQRDVINKLESAGFIGLFDFCYVPSTFTTGKNKGYAFINFLTNQSFTAFVTSWHGKHTFGTATTLNVTKATIQGLEANVQRWGGPRIRRIRNPEFRPYVVPRKKASAETNGVALTANEEPFPTTDGHFEIPQHGASSWLASPMILPVDNQGFDFSDAGVSSFQDASGIDVDFDKATEPLTIMAQHKAFVPGDEIVLQCSELNVQPPLLISPPPGLSPVTMHSI